MEAHTCNHPLVPHTVEYSVGSGSTRRPFDDLESADAFAQKIIRQNASKRLVWLKIFRSDNESYVCFRWDNPKKENTTVEPQETVKLEVDMEPLKEAFDNVAQGFKEQGQSIRRLQFFQGILATAVVLSNVIFYVAR